MTGILYGSGKFLGSGSFGSRAGAAGLAGHRLPDHHRRHGRHRYVFFKIQNALTKGGIRSEEADEIAGLDRPEMGVLAYDNLQIREIDVVGIGPSGRQGARQRRRVARPVDRPVGPRPWRRPRVESLAPPSGDGGSAAEAGRRAPSRVPASAASAPGTAGRTTHDADVVRSHARNSSATTRKPARPNLTAT